MNHLFPKAYQVAGNATRVKAGLAGVKKKAVPVKAVPVKAVPVKAVPVKAVPVKADKVSNVNIAEDVFDADGGMDKLEHILCAPEEMGGGLDYESWLPFAANVYNISKRPEDYIIVKTMICPSTIPNRNGIAFPAEELAKFRPPPTNRQVFKAWAQCPVHYNHDNGIHDHAYGVIFDTAMSRITGFNGGKLWKVMGLLGIDKTKNPDTAQDVLARRVNTYSMGALADEFRCSFCGMPVTNERPCQHISDIGAVNWREITNYDGQKHLVFLNAYGIQPIECSIVEDPAWAPALSDEVEDVWGTGVGGTGNTIEPADALNEALPASPSGSLPNGSYDLMNQCSDFFGLKR